MVRFHGHSTRVVLTMWQLGWMLAPKQFNKNALHLLIGLGDHLNRLAWTTAQQTLLIFSPVE